MKFIFKIFSEMGIIFRDESNESSSTTIIGDNDASIIIQSKTLLTITHATVS